MITLLSKTVIKYSAQNLLAKNSILDCRKDKVGPTIVKFPEIVDRARSSQNRVASTPAHTRIGSTLKNVLQKVCTVYVSVDALLQKTSFENLEIFKMLWNFDFMRTACCFIKISIPQKTVEQLLLVVNIYARCSD